MPRTNPQTLDVDYLTVSETAKYLKCCTRTVRRLIAEGKLSSTRLGDGPNSHFRVSTVSIEKLLAAK